MKSELDQKREIERLLSKYDSKIATAFMEGVRVITDSVSLSRLAEEIRNGSTVSFLNLFNEAMISAGFISFSRTLQDALIAGGDLGTAIGQANKIEFGFKIAESNTARFLQNYQAERIKQISNEMRLNIDRILYREVSAGSGPIEIARQIKQGLGLTSFQESHIINYRKYLEDSETRALINRLRDKRYDATVARAIREGKPLSKPQIDKMVEAYARKYLRRRSETIARTESMAMINSGNHQYWNQAVKSGIVQEKEILRFWKHSHDSKVRSSHIQIPNLNENGVGLNVSFRSPLGLIRYPGDPAASAANRINCRCYLAIRIFRP